MGRIEAPADRRPVRATAGNILRELCDEFTGVVCWSAKNQTIQPQHQTVIYFTFDSFAESAGYRLRPS